MKALIFLQEKAEQEGTGFIPFKDERDELGNLKGLTKRSCSRINNKKSEHIFDRTTSNTSKTSQINKKVRFLKEIYSTHGNSDWCSLTHLRKLDKKFQLNIETEFQVQKPLTGLNQKLQFNDGIVRKLTTNICNSPRLGKKQKTENYTPPLGYYQPQEIFKRQPMLVFMDQQIQNQNRLSQHKFSRTEASTAQLGIRPRLSPNKDSPIPQEILEKAFKTERIITQQKYKYVPQMIDEKNLDNITARINSIRQKILHQKMNSLSNQ
ncbi:unnamed protein product [Paramecium pentaurelia]|uniref:Uncharacterized protein n=1 Tax=Paramecium pentaurelia TaxID=43138 RepID=A0A8S1VMV6_9CILI|nr:unnamed protein product [Paramecium pentaurelia]CAD8176951.1 unnamed protein product [Paramecium pentaurelia]